LIGSREEKIFRYTPRENEAVNGPWMCDAGRLNYQWIQRADRLREVLVRGQKTTWSTALNELADKLKQAPAGSVAIIASARQTNEELWLIAKLKAKLGAISDAIPRFGEGDKLLVSQDKNPNTNGARLTGICFTEMGINLTRIADGITQGKIKTLLVFGENLAKRGVSNTQLRERETISEVVEEHGLTAEVLAKLETLVVSDILPNETTKLAHYILPGCAPAEKRGTFTNVKGRVQKFMKAVEAPGDARPEWEFLHALVHHVTGQNGFVSIEGLFNQMAKEVPAFNGLTWAALGDTGVTVQI
jgi:NADH-quinone oxidoreductase subunit G